MNVSIVTRKILEFEEGWRSEPYYDSLGFPTIGHGFLIGDKNAPLPKFTLPKPVGDKWLEYLIFELETRMASRICGLTVERKAIILSMCYQIGIAGCLSFKKMWKAIDNRDWEEAANQMLDSKWARSDSPNRAKRHAQVMRHNSLLKKGAYEFLEWNS